MGSIALDNGESVYIHDGTGSADPVAISAAEGSSVANLMKNRERFDYTWANSSERTAQTGMLQGSRGYQEDTKTEYIYDSSAWRLATPYIEFAASSTQSVAATVYTAATGWAVDGSRSTDTSIVTVSSNAFTFVRAGLYMITYRANIAVQSGSSFCSLTTDSPATATVTIGASVGNIAMCHTVYRISADGTILYAWMTNGTTASSDSKIMRIARLG